MVKLLPADQAQQVIDKAVQLFGSDGARTGSVVETLYREVLALRIYEAASEAPKALTGRQSMAANQ